MPNEVWVFANLMFKVGRFRFALNFIVEINEFPFDNNNDEKG